MANYNKKTLQDTFCMLIQLLLYTVRYRDGVVWITLSSIGISCCISNVLFSSCIQDIGRFCSVCLYNYVSVCVILPAIYWIYTLCTQLTRYILTGGSYYLNGYQETLYIHSVSSFTVTGSEKCVICLSPPATINIIYIGSVFMSLYVDPNNLYTCQLLYYIGGIFSRETQGGTLCICS